MENQRQVWGVGSGWGVRGRVGWGLQRGGAWEWVRPSAVERVVAGLLASAPMLGRFWLLWIVWSGVKEVEGVRRGESIGKIEFQ